jgi:hypothetical protein
MNKSIITATVALILTLLCLNAKALFILDPETDIKTVKKEIKNEDGTTTIVEEPEIVKSFSDVKIPEKIAEEIKTKKNNTIAKGFENRLGLYKPQQAMFTVTTKKPENWPISDNYIRTAKDKSSTSTNKPVSYGWVITTLSLGIIAFASFKLYMHFKEEPDITRI